MSKCLLCEKTFYDFREVFDVKGNYVCEECSKRYETTIKHIDFAGMKLHYLFLYDDEHMSDLLTLKGMGVKEMSDVLILPKVRSELRKMFKHSIFLYMPSSEEDDEERGFRHVEALFHDIARTSEYPLFKIKKHKQALLKLNERKKIKEILQVHDNFELPKGKIVLVDDIISSGSTLMAAKELLGIKECEFLVLFNNHKEELK